METPNIKDQQELAEVEEEQDKEQRVYRKRRRAARVRAGEIRELNIVAMMDVMTIILVFLLMSYTASVLNVQQSSELIIPRSSIDSKPQDNISITLTLAEVSVNDKKIAPVVDGAVPAAYRADRDEKNLLIVPLLEELRKEVDKQKYIARYNANAPFSGRVNIIADKRLPYQTIIAVLYTAGQAELGQYQLLALKNE